MIQNKSTPQTTKYPQSPDIAIGLDVPPYSLDTEQKQPILIDALKSLTRWHESKCVPYASIIERIFYKKDDDGLEGIPWLPVSLFKTQDLYSVENNKIIKTLTSSGTTGQAVSRIYLDRETSIRQTRALTTIMSNFLGKHRLPMVIVDSNDLLKDRSKFNARAAGILGFSIFGRQHHYCLNESLELQLDSLESFLDHHRGKPILVFGFTFIVWQNLLQAVKSIDRKIDFGSNSILIHGGGWKRLQEQHVDNITYKALLKEYLGLKHVFNYYGMVEQVGSIFMECEYGHLHTPVFADVIIRHPITLNPLPNGNQGVIQVLSALPVSYPGHSLLTEDIGIVHGEDDCPCGRLGRYFTVIGRLPKVELRGCSDTREVSA